MSVKELELIGLGPNNVSIKEFEDKSRGIEIQIEIWTRKIKEGGTGRGMPVVLDWGQAHLLKLWLEEHLK